MNFPNTLSPDLNTRAGRMLAAGRVKVTVTSHATGEHITILFKAFCDNRDRQFKSTGKNWEPCTLDEATHVFVEVPNQGDWNDKVGTFYPRNGRWYSADNADPARVYAAALVARWVNGETFESHCQEASECARCGLELTDPVSIARGIGPVCLGNMTGSQHQVKVKEAVEQRDIADATYEKDGQTVLVEHKTEESRGEETREQVVQQIGAVSDLMSNLPSGDGGTAPTWWTTEIEMELGESFGALQRALSLVQQLQEDADAAKMNRDQTFLGR